MATIAGLQDFRQEGPPADIGVFQFPASIMVFQHTFSGVTYICAVRAGARGWVLVSYGAVATTVINAATAAGRDVYVCSGTYSITADCTIPSNTTLRGAGSSTVFYVANGRPAAMVAITNANHAGGNTGIVIRDLYVDGNRANQTGATAGWANISLVNCTDSVIERVWCTNSYGEGVQLGDVGAGDGSDNNFVSNLHSWANSHCGLWLGNSERNVVVNCDLSSSVNFYGIHMIFSSLDNIFTNVKGATNALNFIFIEAGSVRNTLVNCASINNGETAYICFADDCIFDACKANLPTTRSGFQITDCVGNIISSCQITNMAFGVYINNSDECLVVDCLLKGMQYDAVYFATGTPDNNEVANNMIAHNNRYGVNFDGAGTLNWVHGNKIIGAEHDHGIYISAASGNIIQDNFINLTAGYAIFLDGDANSNLIFGNYTNGNTTGSVRVNDAACDTNRIWGNNFEEGIISDVGTGTTAFDNYDPSANAWIAAINAPVGGR